MSYFPAKERPTRGINYDQFQSGTSNPMIPQELYRPGAAGPPYLATDGLGEDAPSQGRTLGYPLRHPIPMNLSGLGDTIELTPDQQAYLAAGLACDAKAVAAGLTSGNNVPYNQYMQTCLAAAGWDANTGNRIAPPAAAPPATTSTLGLSKNGVIALIAGTAVLWLGVVWFAKGKK
jgi:hypothetical protein